MKRIVALLVLAWPVDALAHGTSKSFAEWILKPRTAELRINFAGHDLAAAVPDLDADADRKISLVELDAHREVIGRRSAEHTRLSASTESGGPKQLCAPDGEPVVEGLGEPVVSEVRVRVRWTCPDRIGSVHIESHQLPELEPPHVTVATVIAGRTTAQHVFTHRTPVFTLDVELPTVAEELGGSALRGLRALFAPASLLFLLGLLLFERTKSTFILFLVYLVGSQLGGALLAMGSPDWVQLTLALSVAFVGAELAARRGPMPLWKPIAALPLAVLHGAALADPSADLVNRSAAALAQAGGGVALFAVACVLSIVLGDEAGGYRRPVGIAWLCGAGALSVLVFV